MLKSTSKKTRIDMKGVLAPLMPSMPCKVAKSTDSETFNAPVVPVASAWVVEFVVGVFVTTDNSPSTADTVTFSNEATLFSNSVTKAVAAAPTALEKSAPPTLSEMDTVNTRSKLTLSMRRPRR